MIMVAIAVGVLSGFGVVAIFAVLWVIFPVVPIRPKQDKQKEIISKAISEILWVTGGIEMNEHQHIRLGDALASLNDLEDSL